MGKPGDELRVAQLKAMGYGIRGVQRHLGLSFHAARRMWHAVPPAEPPAPKPDPVEETRRRLEHTRALAAERQALEAIAGEKSLRAALDELVRQVTPAFGPPTPYRAPEVSSGASEETMLALLSDWHAYSAVDPLRTMGLNAYGSEAMGRRVWRVTDTIRSIKRRMERGGGWRFSRLVAALNGDFVDGTIHESERHSDAPNIVRAVYGCGMLVAHALRDLAAEFDEVDVFCTSGNHGRLPDARRMLQKDPTRNWDTLVYLFAREALRDCPNVAFFIPDSYTVVYEVGPWRFLQNHGHEIRSWMNIPFYGINRKVTNINAIRSQAGEPVHYCLFSHFHNAGSLDAPGGEYFINGSLIGGTEFSVEALGRCDQPKQWLLAVHDDHGVTSRWPILAGPGTEGPTYPVQPWG